MNVPWRDWPCASAGSSIDAWVTGTYAAGTGTCDVLGTENGSGNGDGPVNENDYATALPSKSSSVHSLPTKDVVNVQH